METSGHSALVLWTFLQADSGNSEYREELRSLVKDISCNGPRVVYDQGNTDLESDGYLESDGHLCSNISLLVQDIAPLVDVQLLVNREEAEAVQRVAEELRQIAAQLEHSVVANATQSLSNNLRTSPTDHWKDLLRQEVENVLRQGVGLEHLNQERVFVALTFTLVKRVCEQAPVFLRGLFNSALQYIMPGNTR
uniref:BH3-interacting domain death agonist n=1 Tax=Sphaeramia orbicularis TaxID=375764 RepID=A0A672ZSD2_9TELE